MTKEDDSTRQTELLKVMLKEKSRVHQSLLEYLGISVDEINPKTKKVEESQELYQILIENHTLINKCEFREFLETISHLWKGHQSVKAIKYKIESLLIFLKKDIESIFTEKEMFNIFHKCKKKNYSILLILVEQNILSIETIIKNIVDDIFEEDLTIKYFYPEIRNNDAKFFNKLIDQNYHKLKKFVEKNDHHLDLFDEIRKNGCEEPKMIELIRKDKIDEFISFVESYTFDLNEKIQINKSDFKKHPKNKTPIEYSVLFGSISIFKYLYLKGVKINEQNIFKYAVQGRNYKIIHLLEDRKDIIDALEKKPIKYLQAAIKMHHNEIFEYFMTNYYYQVTKRLIHYIFFYRNYQLFYQLIESHQIDINEKVIINNIFNGFCSNGNEEIVKILINHPNIDINMKGFVFSHFFQEVKIQKSNTNAPR